MKTRNIMMAVAAASLATVPVAVQAGTTASSVSPVSSRASGPASETSQAAAAKSYVLLYLLGAITLGALIALLSGGKACQSRGVSVACR